MRVVSTCPASSAGTFSNLMVMLGCWSWNSAASFFISGELPTQEKKRTVVGWEGSLTAPCPSPLGSGAGLLEPSPQATSPMDAIERRATTAAVLRNEYNLTEPAPWALKRQCRSHDPSPMQIVWL